MADRRRTGDDERPAGGSDAVDWTWDIEREWVQRTIRIRMSRTLLASTGLNNVEAARARETFGRNYVEAVLNFDNPPSYREANTLHADADDLVDRWEQTHDVHSLEAADFGSEGHVVNTRSWSRPTSTARSVTRVLPNPDRELPLRTGGPSLMRKRSSHIGC